jgi:ribonuclease HI
VTPTALKRAFGVHDLAEFRVRMEELRAELKPPTSVGEYTAHTDGACLGNPEGPGGWAAVVSPSVNSVNNDTRWLLWGHLSSTSNNRAEALGVLGALEWVPAGSRLALHSDSELTVRILQGRYKAKANPDIWEMIRSTVASKQLVLTPEWVRGHAGDPLNELADRLSKLGATDSQLDSLTVIDRPVVTVGLVEAAPPELAGLEPHGNWERDFIKSITRQLRSGRALSPKQQAVIDRLRERRAEPPGET